MTETMEFLEVKREHSEVFEKSWNMYEKQGVDLKEEAMASHRSTTRQRANHRARQAPSLAPGRKYMLSQVQKHLLEERSSRISS